MTDTVPGLKREYVIAPLHADVYCLECGNVPAVGDELFSDERPTETLYFDSEDCAHTYLRRELTQMFGDE